MSDTANSEFYPSARPGAAHLPGPTPTSRNYHPIDSHPPPPQAGAIPVPPTTPPPKAREALRSPGYYFPAASQKGPSPASQPHYPPQTNWANSDNTPQYNGQVPGYLTATPLSPHHTTSLNSQLSGSTHNPQIASDTSSFQSQNSFSPQWQQHQQQGNNYQSGEYPHQLPNTYQQSRNDSGFEELNSGYWETVKKWASNMGEYVNGINEKASKKLM